MAARSIVVVVVVALFSLLLALPGCKKQIAKQDAKRDEMFAQVTPCPAPATCTAKLTAGKSDVSVCAPSPDTQSYLPGDIVVVKEVGVFDTVARVKAHRGKVYDVEFVDGFTQERSAGALVARLCK